MKVFAGHDSSGCAFYRVISPLGELGRHGHNVTLVSAEMARGGVSVSQMAGHDIVVAQRWDEHEGMGTWRRMRAHSRLVYEVDDDVFSVEPVNWAAYSRYSRADVQDAVAHGAEVADVVTVTTEPLAEVMRQFNPNVAILPNHIPGFVCDMERPRRDRPVVGWQGGASHGRDIGVIAAPLRRFLDRYPGWDARLMGVDYRPTIKHERVLFTPWTHITDDPRAYYGSIDFDIGLAPIFPTTFARSKSAIKALEYAALGIPVIASDSEPYRDFVLHGVTGYLVRRDHEWLKYLTELASDDAMREEMGAKAREVARGWTIEQGWKRWEQAYSSLLLPAFACPSSCWAQYSFSSSTRPVAVPGPAYFRPWRKRSNSGPVNWTEIISSPNSVMPLGGHIVKIRMLVEKTGPRHDGRYWPPRGGEIIVSDEEGAALCAQGDAAPVADLEADVETRAEGGGGGGGGSTEEIAVTAGHTQTATVGASKQGAVPTPEAKRAAPPSARTPAKPGKAG